MLLTTVLANTNKKDTKLFTPAMSICSFYGEELLAVPVSTYFSMVNQGKQDWRMTNGKNHWRFRRIICCMFNYFISKLGSPISRIIVRAALLVPVGPHDKSPEVSDSELSPISSQGQARCFEALGTLGN